MLIRYDYLDSILSDSFFKFEPAPDFRHSASELMDLLDLESFEEIDQAVQRAIKGCQAMGIPVNRNFKQVFRYNGDCLEKDYKLTSLASYLVIINADPGNTKVAQTQLIYYMKLNQPTN